MKTRILSLLSSFLILAINVLHADVVLLKNGDRLTGTIIEKGDAYLKINTTLLGETSIDQKLIERIMTDAEAASTFSVPAVATVDAATIEAKYAQELADTKAQLETAKAEAVAAKEASTAAAAPAEPAPAAETKPKNWNTKLSAGYVTTNGNTKTSHANLGIDATYKKNNNEWGVKGQMEYGSDKGKMNVQKYYAKAKSDTRLGDDKKWFNTRSVEISHDRFSNIDYRVLPAFGFGYWYWEKENSKFETDLALGYEYTNFRDSTKASGNFSLIPHLYYDRNLVGKLKFAQDLTFYPSLENFSNYRFRSETSLINPLSDVLNWKMSFVDEFNSTPKGTTKKNDTTLMSSIEYQF